MGGFIAVGELEGGVWCGGLFEVVLSNGQKWGEVIAVAGSDSRPRRRHLCL